MPVNIKKKLVLGGTQSSKTSSKPQTPSVGIPSWAIRGSEVSKSFQQERSKRRVRPAEFWLRSGETKRIRFRSNESLGAIWQYSVRTGAKSWERFTAPRGEGSADLFATRLNLRPSLREIYEVIDIDGYKDDSGKVHRNLPRFLALTERIRENLIKAQQRLERKGLGLSDCVCEISKTGEGPTTTYLFMFDEASDMTLEQKKIKSLAPEFRTLYAPLSLEAQEAIVAEVERFAEVSPD